MAVTVESLTRIAGFHRWPGATGTRSYLANKHRHLFHIRVEAAVDHNEREVEYHDLGRMVVTNVHHYIGHQDDGDPTLWDFGTRSCESIATELAQSLTEDGLDLIRVSVSEDDEYTSTWRPDSI